jgi:uncharacterized protein YbcI
MVIIINKGVLKMHFKNQFLYEKIICDAHNECQEQILGKQSVDTVAVISRNKVVIISKDIPVIKDKNIHFSIRGRRIDHILAQMKRDEYHSSMKVKLSEITGHTVKYIQSNIPLNSEENVEVYCFDRNFLLF